METELSSKAELAAQKCLEYTFCKNIRLDSIKQKLARALNHIGDNNMFSEYTMHDISHVNGMLALLDKIIPEDTVKQMTKADWLMVVLAIYFHDLGMLVTNEEFCQRESNADFQTYKNKALQNQEIAEYVKSLGDDDRFLYQEFVRKNHGKRICEWVSNCNKKEGEPYSIINEMLTGVDETFRKDLALVCKSHQDDVLDEQLQSVDEAYGPSDDEKVNLLYCSVLLRVSDILHVTHDRTPDIEYRIISPKNKISIVEWAKQKSVRSVNIKKELGSDGHIDNTIQPHRFEIQAKFCDDKGYFSFKSYIQYAVDELRRCNKWCNESRIHHNNQYIFPWDDIDTSRVQADGFSKDLLKFEIDQKSILNLLTGHTLYNDPTVVLRELIQNAIDAGRLQNAIEKEGSTYKAKVKIHWNSKTRELRISDNATGMDTKTISDYLLKVGSSKYNNEQFVKDFPDFHSISRFGIGLLTCFMISDDVDIYTLDANENQCHLLKIRNLNGEYLMRNDADSKDILEGKHGTTFVLYVRPEIKMDDVEKQIKQWIVVPEADVTLKIDDDHNIVIGKSTCKEVIESYTKSITNVVVDNQKYRIYSKDVDGITIACLQRFNQYTKVWSLYHCSEQDSIYDAPIGICIEGIKVTSATPGLKNDRYLVLVNCTGKKSPSTNVARNDLEQNEALKELYAIIYKQYFDMFINQVEKLEASYSKTWVTNEINYYIDSFCNPDIDRGVFADRELFLKVLADVPCNIIDNGRSTDNVSLNALPTIVNTLDSVAYKSAIALLKDVKSTSKTPLGLLSELDGTKVEDGLYLQDSIMSDVARNLFFDIYSVKDIIFDSSSRRVRLMWERDGKEWMHYPIYPSRYRHNHIFIPVMSTPSVIDGIGSCNIIVSGDKLFICPNTEIQKFLRKLICDLYVPSEVITIICSYIETLAYSYSYRTDLTFERFFDSEENYIKKSIWDYGFTADELKKIINKGAIQTISIQNYYHYTE